LVVRRRTVAVNSRPVTTVCGRSRVSRLARFWVESLVGMGMYFVRLPTTRNSQRIRVWRGQLVRRVTEVHSQCTTTVNAHPIFTAPPELK
jgi:hypothetical protein